MSIIKKGSPYPLGATPADLGVNFALFSKHNKVISLVLLDPMTKKVIEEFTLSHRTGDIWHIFITGLKLPVLYAYRIHGHLLIDPYAKALSSPHTWGGMPEHPYTYHPLGLIEAVKPFDWQGVVKPKRPLSDVIIYEMHVRGFTEDPSSGVKNRGSYLGVIEKIPYLLDLGVNTVELLPVHEFNECENHRINPVTKKHLYNYWGYSTVHFFTPMNRYAVQNAREEFKTMVRELHRHGIEVILDVVFNHTAEKKSTLYSFMGIDHPIYYLVDDRGQDRNFTGCGNTMNLNHPVTRHFVVDCLKYWVEEMQVDGFRFDLASIMYRDRFGRPVEYAPLIEDLSFDPALIETKLIAEPWDAAGLYQVGGFSPSENRWSEWNGKYRDGVRSFIKGDMHSKNEFARRISGSQDIYPARSPQASINFITCHDGFSLNDLVSYNQKHNLENGEQNRDGNNNNLSWNCGVEGETTDPKIEALRLKQMKNFMLALFVSQGVPMILMGDEYEQTREGNNNTYCQDNELNWFLWDEKSELYDFIKQLIKFRKEHPMFRKESFLSVKDVTWHGTEPYQINWNDEKPLIAFMYLNQVYVAFNATEDSQTLTLPPPPKGKKWSILFQTDQLEVSDEIHLPAYSSVLLIN